MRNLLIVITITVGIIASLLFIAIANDAWELYYSEDYGFSMLIPVGMKFEKKEYKGGWGLLTAKHEEIQFYVLGKLGTDASEVEIEEYGVKITDIPAKYWEEIDSGEYEKGWKWYRVVKAVYDNSLVFGGYGVGSKGSYMLILKTKKGDFEKNQKDYMKWYRSIRLF